MSNVSKVSKEEYAIHSFNIRGGIYLTIEGYRRLMGFATGDAIRKALRQGRIVGAIKIGNTWIIPRDAIMIDGAMTHGGYRELKRIKEEYARRTEEMLAQKQAKEYNKRR